MGKKRNLGKEGGSSEIKEVNEKKGGDREASRGRGGSNRRGRGISRGREGKKNPKIQRFLCNIETSCQVDYCLRFSWHYCHFDS